MVGIIVLLPLPFLSPVLSLTVFPCCPTIQFNVADPHSEVHSLQGARLGFYSQIGFYGARPQYKQQGGRFYIFFSVEDNEWMNTEFHVGNTTTGLVNEVPTYCADSVHGWTFFNGSDWVRSRDLISSCTSMEHTCCTSITISSASSTSNTSQLYSEETRDSLGLYSAVGKANGRYLYQAPGMDRYLEYISSGDWLVSDRVGQDEGFISHVGGSVCAEDAGNKWEVSVWKEDTKEYEWAYDTLLTVDCKKEEVAKEKARAGGGQRITGLSSGLTRSNDNNDRTIIAGMSILSFVLFVALIFIFGKRFYKAWSNGAHGKQLLLESIDF